MPALALSFAVCALILAAHFVSGGDLFLVLAKGSGGFIMTVWIFIIVAHARMRLAAAKSGVVALPFKAWLYPVGNAIALLALVTVLLAQAVNPDTRLLFGFMVLVTLTIIASYFALRKRYGVTLG